MPADVKLERIEEVPADARVCHFDELPDSSQQLLAELVGSPPSEGAERRVPPEIGGGECDVIVFTEYLSISD